MKETIPNIEELFKYYSNLYHFEEGSPEYLIDKEDFKTSLIKFTRYHVISALVSASEKADTKYVASMMGGEFVIDKDSILNAYPLELIK